MRIPKLVLFIVCASALVIVGISHIPEISSETDADTKCRDKKILVQNLIHHNYICVDESTAIRWLDLGLARIISTSTINEGECSGGRVQLKNPHTGEINCVKATLSKKLLKIGWGQHDLESTDYDTQTPPTHKTIDNKKEISKFNYEFANTDSRFTQCFLLHDDFVKLGQREFRKQNLGKTYLNQCIQLYVDPSWGYFGDDRMEKLHSKFIEIGSKDTQKSDFFNCMIFHSSFLELGESTFRNKNNLTTYIDDCIKLYNDPVWDYNGDHRKEKLYSRFTELKSTETTKLPTSPYVELLYSQPLEDGKYRVKFNACAGNETIHHAKFLIKSKIESVEIGTYKDLTPTKCRTYDSTIHAKHPESIQVLLIEHVSNEK